MEGVIYAILFIDKNNTKIKIAFKGKIIILWPTASSI